MIEEFHFNIFNSIIAVGVIHGFFFSFFIFFRKKYNTKLHVFLALTVLALSLNNLQYWLYDVELLKNSPVLTKAYFLFEMLIGPFFYLFVDAYLQKQICFKKVALVLTPFGIATISRFISYTTFQEEVYKRVYNSYLEIVILIFNILFLFLIFRAIFIYEKKSKLQDGNKIIIKTAWLKTTLFVALGTIVFWVLGNHFITLPGFTRYYPLWITISFLIYWIAYAAIFKAKLFKERKVIRKKVAILEPKSFIQPQSLVNSKSEKKKTNSKLYADFEQLITEEKLYLNSQLSLDYTATKLNISANYLSQIVNNHSNYSFTDYINQQRIGLAKQLLVDPEFDKYTILSIALETGFNSKSSFYNAFKKVTQITPTQYKKSQLN
ncbi:helix-turn-helix domain-containing protein [uncultured Dokdonia sp.]|uniref:helix-turn-helix domain-containing protein n=1 Tax=uncultured Dokdonia sp. TaxID=575653 RepID=UPI00261B9AB4|nr:helix-turn-helix domain-containing protein [uncultured Dokdonia sp.]